MPTADAANNTVFSIIADRRRRLQLPLLPPARGRTGELLGVIVVDGRSRRCTRKAGGAPGSRWWSPTATIRCCSPPSRTGGGKTLGQHPRRPRPRPRASGRRFNEAGRSLGSPTYVYIAGTPHLRRRGPRRLPQLAADLLPDARGRARPGERRPGAGDHGDRDPHSRSPSTCSRAAPAPRAAASSANPRSCALLNRRLSVEIGRPPARRAQPQGRRAEPRAGLQARRARPDVGRGQPRAEPAARGDEDLPRRRAAAADPQAARGGAHLVPAHRRPDRPHGRHHPPAQVLRPQGRRRPRAGRPARQRPRRARR